MASVDTAMLLAAGLGTRLKPFTLKHPKALAPVNGKPVLWHNVQYLKRHGIRRVVINVHHFADQIVDYLGTEAGVLDMELVISDESHEVLETGGGIQKAVPLFGTAAHIVVLNADILTDLDLTAMIEAHVQGSNDATLAVSDRQSSRAFLFDADMRLSGWQNSQTGEQRMVRDANPLHPKAFSGLHVIAESIFRHMPMQGKFSMVDAYLAMAARHRIMAFQDASARLIDIGTMEKLQQAAAMFG